jgi:TetR/AcrR family transcriptional regulator
MQKRAIRTRESILKAATREFARKGLHGSRVDSIARKAGVNKQRIYAYYGNKEKLFEEVLRHVFMNAKKREKDILPSLTEKDIPNLADILLRQYIEMHRENTDFWRLIAWENLEGGRHSHVMREIQEPVLSRIRQLYETGQRKGYYSPNCSFISFMYALYAVSYFYFATQKTIVNSLGIDIAGDEQRERTVSEVVEMLRYGNA